MSYIPAMVPPPAAAHGRMQNARAWSQCIYMKTQSTTQTTADTGHLAKCPVSLARSPGILM
eukprot:COSAG02_NODE_1030_length_15077_cov_36.210119_16_plen_61_part_00